MTHAVQIGLAIRKRLFNDFLVNESVGEKIFPLVAELGTMLPFITYERQGVQSTFESKDGHNEDTVTFVVNIVSESYSEAVNIAYDVQNALTFRQWNSGYQWQYNTKVDKLILNNCHCISIDETFSENNYVQTMTFECSVTNN